MEKMKQHVPERSRFRAGCGRTHLPQMQPREVRGIEERSPSPCPLPRGEGGKRRRFFELFDLETGFVQIETRFVALYNVKGRPARFMKSCLGGLAAPKSDKGGKTM